MTAVAVRVEGISKRYRLGPREKYRALRDTLTDVVYAPYRSVSTIVRHRTGEARRPPAQGFIWALKDVSFEVKPGEVVGLIGRNGAGKSTLLRILSRVTEPTEGRGIIRGRVGSLLEVGTGFHPELTGRENTYLNGTILGMRRRDIDRKFDEIVGFAEVEQHIDTPVKYYSSGMYVRLAFAVAAHLEPEILLVDEVLAVGDAAFQRKCLGKIGSVAREGRTVLFVSHNMGAIVQLCPTCIVLQQGRIAASGPSKETVEWYLASLAAPGKTLQTDHPDRSGDGRLRFRRAYLRNEAGAPMAGPISGHPVEIILEYEAGQDLTSVQFMFTIYNHQGIPVTHCNVDAYGQRFRIPQGSGQVVCRIPKLPLPRSTYRVAAAARDLIGFLDVVPAACVFDVEASTFFPTTYMPPTQYCAALVDHSWRMEPAGGPSS